MERLDINSINQAKKAEGIIEPEISKIKKPEIPGFAKQYSTDDDDMEKVSAPEATTPKETKLEPEPEPEPTGSAKPESEKSKTETSKKISEDEFSLRDVKEEDERTMNCLDSTNQGFFKRMSEGGKAIANKIYEGLNKMPWVSKVIGKKLVADEQIMLDRYEKKAAKQNDAMSGIDLNITALDKAKSILESRIESLGNKKAPIASLQIELRNIEKRKMKLMNEKDRIQTKFEEFDNKVKLYTNKRDQIADNFIGRFEKMLEPMEKELENLQTCKDRLDLLSSSMELKHEKKLEELNELEKEKNELEEAFRSSGISERKIKRNEALKVLEDSLTQGRDEIRKEKEEMERRKLELDKKIQKADAKANPYRDKRDEFVRAKSIRPIEMDAPERKREKVFKGREEIKIHGREEELDDEDENDKDDEIAKKETEAKDKEKNEKYEEWQTVSKYIDIWNYYVRNKGDKDPKKIINREDFLREADLEKNFKLDSKQFQKFVEKYCKIKKIKDLSGEMEPVLRGFGKSFAENKK